MHLLKDVKDHIMFLDFDGPGQYTQSGIIDILGRSKCFTLPQTTKNKDANDFIKPNGQDISLRRESLKLFIKSASPIPLDGIHIASGDLEKTMYSYYKDGKPKALKCHVLPSNNFKWLPGDISLFYGRPASGKSVFMRFMAYNMSLKENWKWACYCAEDYPVYEFYDDLIHMYLGKTVDEGYNTRCSFDEYKQGLEWVKSHFFTMEPTGSFLPDNKWLNERIDWMRNRYNIDGYIKDPWNKIKHDYIGREDNYLQEAIGEEKLFARDYKAACYVAHPRTLQKSKDGKYSEPSPYEISGGSMFYNAFDNIFCVHRPNYDANKADKLVTVNQWKVKKQKRVGIPDSHNFIFDRTTNRYNDSYNNTIDEEKDVKPNMDWRKGPAKPDQAYVPTGGIIKNVRDIDENDLPF